MDVFIAVCLLFLGLVCVTIGAERRSFAWCCTFISVGFVLFSAAIIALRQ